MKPALLNLSGKIVQSLCNFLIVVQVSQGMGPDGRGLTALFGVILAAALAVGESGGGSALIFQLSHFKASSLLKPASFALVAAAIVVPTGFVMAGKIDKIYFASVVIAALVLLFYTLGLHLLLSARRVIFFSILQALPALCLLLMLVVFGRMSQLTPLYYLWFYSGAYGLGLAIVWFAIWHNKFLEQKKVLPAANVASALRPALLNQAGHVVALVNNRLAFLIFPAVAMGIYSNALALSEALLLGAGSAGQMLYSRFAGERASVFLWQRWTLRVAAITGLGAIVLGLLPGEFYVWLFGQEFGATKEYLPVLLPAIIFYSIYLVMSYYFSSRGWFQFNIWCMLVSLFTQVIALGCFWAAGRLNLWSAALSYVTGATVLAVFSFILFKRRTTA